MKSIEITPSEWEVMRVLWANGELGSSDIVKVLEKKKEWKPTTTKTLLARLVAKNCVETKGTGNKYLYRPLVGESEAWDSAARDLFGFVCSRDRGKKLSRLIEAEIMSEADIALVEQALAHAKKTSVVEVACDCFKGQCSCHIKQR